MRQLELRFPALAAGQRATAARALAAVDQREGRLTTQPLPAAGLVYTAGARCRSGRWLVTLRDVSSNAHVMTVRGTTRGEAVRLAADVKRAVNGGCSNDHP